MKYKKLSIDWNADPNAPEVLLHAQGDKLKVEFYLNSFIFDDVREGDKGELTFTGCFKYNYNTCNDEGYYLGQYRYENAELPWGEFYELEHEWEKDFPMEFVVLNNQVDKQLVKHFIFFFRDNTLECIAKDYEFRRLIKG